MNAFIDHLINNPNWLPGTTASDGSAVAPAEQVRVSNNFSTGFYVEREGRPVMVIPPTAKPRRYRVPNALFWNELFINAFYNQLQGYPVGSPMRLGFQPVVPTIQVDSGLVDRERTLELPAYTFTAEERAALLELAPETGDAK